MISHFLESHNEKSIIISSYPSSIPSFLFQPDASTYYPLHGFSRFPSQCSSIFSIKIPYPFRESCTSTWVTAPMNFPFWIIGLPLRDMSGVKDFSRFLEKKISICRKPYIFDYFWLDLRIVEAPGDIPHRKPSFVLSAVLLISEESQIPPHTKQSRLCSFPLQL